jgi:hypothetical protein
LVKRRRALNGGLIDSLGPVDVIGASIGFHRAQG